MAVTADEARRRLYPLLAMVENDRIAVEIVAKTSRAYLVSTAEYEALQATAQARHLPSDAHSPRCPHSGAHGQT